MSEFGEREQRAVDAWKSIDRIFIGRVIAETKELLLEYIEEPLRPAIGVLYDKNVTTFISSCNLNDYYQGFAWISLDWRGLSDANKQVVQKYPHHEVNEIAGTEIVAAGIKFPIERNDLPEIIGSRALELAEKFEQQDPLN